MLHVRHAVGVAPPLRILALTLSRLPRRPLTTLSTGHSRPKWQRRKPRWLDGDGSEVLWAIAGVNVIVWCGWAFASSKPYDARARAVARVMHRHFTLSAPNIREGRFHTLLTSFFSHALPMHLVTNMLPLAFFGKTLIQSIGPWRFLQVYMGGGLVASLASLRFTIPRKSRGFFARRVECMGASGAVTSMLVVYASLFPRQIVLVNFFIPVPAALLVAAWIGTDIYQLHESRTSTTDHIAHLGGGAFGAMYSLLRHVTR